MIKIYGVKDCDSVKKALDPDEAAKTEWLCKENLLTKRPIIEFENTILVGYNNTNYINEALL
jgi:arsenate reductase-like glutaredoxin family protein